MSSRPAAGDRPARILVVDDERQNRQLLEVMLAQEGFTITAAAGGEEALALVAREPPDLILLDVLMPGMGGYEVTGKLKGGVATRHIPIILVTALDDRDAKLFGLRIGAEDFLTRPVDRAELCTRVRNLLRLKAHSDDALARRDHSMAMVSHDLRALLSGIVLNASLLSEEASDSNEGRRTVEGVMRIQSFASRMNRLIGDLVDVVSIDAGKLALKRVRCDAVALLAETVEAFAPAASAQGISLTSESVERALVCSFDRERMHQVISNLVTNALKFTPPGGAILIRGQRAGDQLRVSVSDTGTGIASDMQEAVFERFLQVGDNDRKGLGLGLYISRCIVESHGGKVWVESALGHGSVFHLTIPGPVSAVPLTAEREPSDTSGAGCGVV